MGLITALSRRTLVRGWQNKSAIGALALICLLFISPGAFASGDIGRYVQLAQVQDTGQRNIQLEEHVRQLTGKIEELSFQLLQLQEQLRRMQEDNEFRFQELEDKQQGRLSKPGSDLAGKEGNNTSRSDRVSGRELRSPKQQPSDVTDANNASGGDVQTAKKPRMIDGVVIFDGTTSGSPGNGGEVPLGTITFDSLGNIVDTALGKPLDLTARLREDGPDTRGNNSGENGDFLSINSPKELFDLGYDYFQIGDYSNSQQVFSEFIERFPDDGKLPNAQFWLGESMLSQANFEGAAKVFLDTQTNWPNARIAPQALLKLGVSLAGMQQRELACATYAKVFKKYPGISRAMKNRVGAEQRSARCLNG